MASPSSRYRHSGPTWRCVGKVVPGRQRTSSITRPLAVPRSWTSTPLTTVEGLQGRDAVSVKWYPDASPSGCGMRLLLRRCDRTMVASLYSPSCGMLHHRMFPLEEGGEHE